MTTRDFLLKVRLTYFFYGLILFFGCIVFFLPQIEYNRAILTIFSVNSFLYGFYISPIINGQKARVDSIQKTIRTEANKVFSMAIKTKKLKKAERKKMLGMLREYLSESYYQRDVAEGEDEYEALITYTMEQSSKKGASPVYAELLSDLVDNQSNRSQLAMDLSARVFRHEWMVMVILFSVTVSFVLLVDTEGSISLQLIKAFLAAGLSMLMIILSKYSTLTHKKAKHLWDPFKKLLSSNFYRID